MYFCCNLYELFYSLYIQQTKDPDVSYSPYIYLIGSDYPKKVMAISYTVIYALSYCHDYEMKD